MLGSLPVLTALGGGKGDGQGCSHRTSLGASHFAAASCQPRSSPAQGQSLFLMGEEAGGQRMPPSWNSEGCDQLRVGGGDLGVGAAESPSMSSQTCLSWCWL